VLSLDTTEKSLAPSSSHHHITSGFYIHREGGETLEQDAQRNCGCPLPGSIQGQVGWSSEKPGVVEDVPAHGKGVGTRWSLRSLPTLTIL